jgi:hypothetical protein
LTSRENPSDSIPAAGRHGDAMARVPAVVMSKIRKEVHMLWTIAVILIILWLLGLVSGYTMGNFIHILLVIAIVIVLVRVIQGRRPI